MPQRTSRKISFSILLILTGGTSALWSAPPAPQYSESYGDYHYHKLDYPLARHEYERILFNHSKANGALQGQPDLTIIRNKIALTLLRENRNKLALKFLSQSNSFSTQFINLYATLKNGYLNNAYTIYESINSSTKFSNSQKEQGQLLGGIIYLEKGDYLLAKHYYQSLVENSESVTVKKIANDVLQSLEKLKALPRKRPWLAGVLSTLLPGLGQLYVGHSADAFKSLFFNTMFIGSAVVIYNLERQAEVKPSASIVFGLVGLLFYLSNITGAIMTAQRYNMFIERNFQQEIRNRYFNLEYIEQFSEVRFDTKY